MSIERLESLYATFQIIGVILVLFTFVAGGLTVYFGWRVNKVQKGESKIKEDLFKLQIVQANAEAAKANQQSAQALKEQERLRNQNLELLVQVEKERLARMELEKQIAPRNLSESDRASIINAMSRFSGMTIKVIRRGELEPYNFANQIAEALQSAGLRVQVEGGIGGMEGPEYGIIWWAHKEKPDIGNALSKLLTDLQIPNRGYFIKDLETDAALRVGLKISKVK